LKQLTSLHKIPVSLFCFLLSCALSGSNPYSYTAGAGEAGCGYVCIMRTGFWTSFHNQAALAYNSSPAAGINYENRFAIKELGIRSAGIIIPAGKTSIGAIYSSSGYPDLRRNNGGVACGMKITDNISLGIQIDLFTEKTPEEYSNSNYLTCQTGLLITVNPDIKLGIHLFNPLPNSLRKTALPSVIRIGIGKNITTSLFAGAESEIGTSGIMIIRTGFEFMPNKRLSLRGAFSTDNSSFSFGLGYQTDPVNIDLACSTHEILGLTSSISLIYHIRRE
jgi:hypothetical protein